MSARGLGVIVLAGDRGPDDPLARTAGVTGKVLVEIGDRPMLTRVLEAVSGLGELREVVLVCPDRHEYAAAADWAGCAYRRIDPARGPAASVAAGLEALAGDRPALVVTGDHPLLTVDWLEQFLGRARASAADAVFGVVDHAAVAERFPDGRRTRYRFSDVAVCGTNLFYFAGPRGRAAAELWREFEADRKKPWRIVGRLGWSNLVRYLLGRLSLDGATGALSARLGARVAAVFVDSPEAAVDVDSADDLAVVRAVVASRAGTAT